MFDELNFDHSQLIDRSELRKVLKNIISDAGMDPPLDEYAVKILKHLDINESGTIDFNEFKAIVRRIIEGLMN